MWLQVDCKDPLRMAAVDVERAHRRIREKVARPPGGTWRYDDLDVRPQPPLRNSCSSDLAFGKPPPRKETQGRSKIGS